MIAIRGSYSCAPTTQSQLSSKNISVLDQKVGGLFQVVFHLSQAIFYLTYGTIEVVYSLFFKKKDSQNAKIKSALHWFYQAITSFCKKIISFSFLHGSAYLGVGLCELALGLHQLKLIGLGIMKAGVALARSGFFIASNLFVLIQSAINFFKSSRLSDHASQGQKESARLQKISASLSFLSALNNIIAVVLMLYGVHTAIIAMFMVMAMSQGCGKAIFEMCLKIY